MMHRSRLCSILLDCSTDTMEAGVRFWQQALGTTVRHADDPTSPYVTLEGGAGGLQLYLQGVHDASRIHLDIETDNVEAEIGNPTMTVGEIGSDFAASDPIRIEAE